MEEILRNEAKNHCGLTAQQVVESRRRHGANMLTEAESVSLWKLYLEKYSDPMVRILLVAAGVSIILSFWGGDFLETVGIILAVLFATTVGFYFERDAARKFSVLTALDEDQAVKVLRDGMVQQIPRHDVVVGDVVIIETGDEVPADGTLFEATDLQINESSLTGELLTTKAVGVASAEGTYAADTVLRSSMVMNGNGRYVVTAVGDSTEIGRVARQATEVTGVKTPLSIQLEGLAKLISKVGTGVSALAFAAFLCHDMLVNALWHTEDYIGMVEVVLRYFMMAVTLIVMAVPEGLPMAITLALALNMRRMLKSNNLVRRLQASETMGAVTVICTDKTGTLTENRMTVVEMVADEETENLAKAIALNTTAHRGVGNPTEVALINWLPKDFDLEGTRQRIKVTDRLPFSTERKFMATLADGQLYVKGAPEEILAMCTTDEASKDKVTAVLGEWQGRAMRTLAFATKRTEDVHDLRNMQLQAVCAISDPLRPEVHRAVADCRKAGIEVKIVTGDTEGTAMEIARQCGLSGLSISGSEFATLSDEEAQQRVADIVVMYRARPLDKQRMVALLQRSGAVVAVTGDGTNDAPALNRAHVGLSLGSGTSVAKQASDITLIDDSFRSIVHAVMWGRSLYRNIQRFIFFQLVVNVAALLLVLAGSVIGTELPLTVTQILWVNLIMDTFAAMALASLPPSREVMDRPPRRKDDFIITPGMAYGIVSIGSIFAIVMFAFLYYIENSGKGITVNELTVFFTTFVMLQWWNLFNARALGSAHSAFRHLLHAQGMVFVLAMIIVGQWLIVTFGGKMFRTEPMSWTTWLAIFASTSPVVLIGEIYRLIRRKTLAVHC